jgi:CRP-like cAMP-binding protein
MALASVQAMRDFDQAQESNRGRLDLLRGVSIFEPLSIAAIDHLAARLQTVVARSGQMIARQGAPGDTFYVIAAGEVEVIVDGKRARTEGPGGFFGEIALLRDVPRTATVTAISDSTLYCLHRDDFIATVTGHAESSAAAEVVVGSRLAGLTPAIAGL